MAGKPMIDDKTQQSITEKYERVLKAGDRIVELYKNKTPYMEEIDRSILGYMAEDRLASDARDLFWCSARGAEVSSIMRTNELDEMRARIEYDRALYALKIQLILVGDE